MGEARYFTTFGPERGPIFWKDGYGAIGVVSTLEPETLRERMPIGMALGGAWDDQGRATWRLIVGKVELLGLWVVVDREFRPAR
jgi:hypothetical protein